MIRIATITLLAVSAAVALPFVVASAEIEPPRAENARITVCDIEGPISFFSELGYKVQSSSDEKMSIILSSREADSLLEAAQSHPKVNIVNSTCVAAVPGVATFFTPRIAFRLDIDSPDLPHVARPAVTATFRDAKDNVQSQPNNAKVLQDDSALLITSWTSPSESHRTEPWVHLAVIRVRPTSP